MINTKRRVFLTYFFFALAMIMFFWFSWKLFLAVGFLLIAGMLIAPVMEERKQVKKQSKPQ